MLKVAVDTETLRLNQKTGHAFYVSELWSELQKQKNISLLSCQPPFSGNLSTVKRFLWDQFLFPYQAWRGGATVLHATAFSIPLLWPRKRVATIHDLALHYFPENMAGISGWFLSRFVPWTLKRTDMLVAISESTKADAMRILQIPEERIAVIPLAVSSFYQPIPSEEQRAVLDKYGLQEKKYFLFVGTLEPRKNLLFLLQVITPLLRQNSDFKLVLVGKRGWQFSEIFQFIQEKEIEKYVVETGYVSDEEKRALYGGAFIFLFPSRYEGFGLPILEAYACGCPVITADNSSLPEVAGNEGILLPLEQGAWREKIGELLLDSALREHYRKYGLSQVKKFSWEKAAEQTVAVYRQVAGDKST